MLNKSEDWDFMLWASQQKDSRGDNKINSSSLSVFVLTLAWKMSKHAKQNRCISALVVEFSSARQHASSWGDEIWIFNDKIQETFGI